MPFSVFFISIYFAKHLKMIVLCDRLKCVASTCRLSLRRIKAVRLNWCSGERLVHKHEGSKRFSGITERRPFFGQNGSVLWPLAPVANVV